jgi:diguanylate cyclase (GGDEF)-like protein
MIRRGGVRIRMVDRDQEQARRLADAIGPDGRAGRDLAWVVVGSVTLVSAAIATDAVDRFVGWIDDFSDRAVNALVSLLVVLAVGAVVYSVRRYRDVNRAHGSLARLADIDGLTGLPNRRFLGEPFEQMLAVARRQNGRIAVLFVDLHGFKQLNEIHGHEVGDRIMVALAERLAEGAGPAGVVVRYAGDEFALLCHDLTNASSAERLGRQILAAIEAPFELDDERLRLSAFIGITVTEERPTRADEILTDAKAAMLQARAKGPGSIALFDRSMREKITPATAERRLRRALENGEFRLYYEPIVSLWTKRLVGAEAVLQWREIGRGSVAPEEFMPALEDTGLIVPVGRWIVEEACRQTRAWQDEFPDRPALNVKVNVSPRQLAQVTFVANLQEALTSSGADPDRLCLEVTERGLLADTSGSWSTLREAKKLGVSLALDDFGTGYSSLSFLREFSLDLLTIDPSFVQGIGRSREDTTIVEHVIGMAKALGIVTVAEGVEIEEQMAHLRAMNCDLAQGRFFSQPQPPDVISQLLGRGSQLQEWTPPDPSLDPGSAKVVQLAPPAPSPTG